MLKATDLGLHSCWVGSFDEFALSRILKIPDNVLPELIITIGYSDEVEQGLDRNPVERVTFFEEFGKTAVEKSFFPLSKYGQNVGKVLERATGNSSAETEQQPQKPFEKMRSWFKGK